MTDPTPYAKRSPLEHERDMEDGFNTVEFLASSCRDIVTGEPLDNDARPDLYVCDVLTIADEYAAMQARIKALEAEIERLRGRNALLEALTDELDFLHHEGGPDSVAALVAEIERLRARVVNLEGRLSAVTTNDMNDFVLMGLARDAAEARVKVLEAAMDKMLFWLDEFSQQVDSSDPACFRSDYNVAVALIDKEAGE